MYVNQNPPQSSADDFAFVLNLRMQRKTLAHHKLHHFWHFPEALQKYFFFPLQKGGKKPSGRISAEKAEKMTVSQEKREGSRYV